jgi:copper oxidase (laccase) domain-containing protein
MKHVYGCKPEELIIGIAPSISMDDYYIREEDQSLINPDAWKGNIERRIADGKSHLHLNLLGNVITQLTSVGVNPVHIQAYGEKVNTFKLAGENPPAAFSHRNGNKGRFLVAAQL